MKEHIMIVLLLVSLTAGTESHTYYVKPSDGPNSTCPANSTNSTCRTLQDYVGNSFSNISVVIFLPGNHALTGVFKIINVRNLSLTGQMSGQSSPVIHCNGEQQSGVTLTNSTGIIITNLMLLDCGTDILPAQHGNISGLFLDTVSNISLSNIIITSGKGMGLYAYNCSGILNIHRSTFRNNSGGNMKLIMKDYPSHQWTISVEHSVIEDGYSEIGGGVLFESKWHSKSYSECLATEGNVFEIISTNFTRNTANKYAGAFLARLFASDCMPSKILFIDCRFDKNNVSNSEGHGSAIRILKYMLPAFYNKGNGFPLYKISIVGSSFHNNNIQGTKASVVELGNVKKVVITNSTFVSNIGTAISMRASNVIFSGSINFTDNRGIDGGALKFCDSSVMFLNNDMTVTFQDNFAKNTGGAIFVQDSCLDQPSACFFQPYPSTSVSEVVHNSLIFINNTANLAGDSIYGGRIDNCFTFVNYAQPLELFHAITSFTPNQTTRQIASDPYRILFCEPISNPMGVVLGRKFHVSIIATGQLNGTTPAIIFVDVSTNHAEKNPKTSLQIDYVPSRECKRIALTLATKDIYIGTMMQLAFGVQHSGSQKVYKLTLDVTVEPCPWGFALQSDRCECIVLWRENNKLCSLKGMYLSRIVRHKLKAWLGCLHRFNKSSCSNQDLLYAYGCGIEDYCNDNVEIVKESAVDEQCAEGRTGILCGSCVEGRSVVLGTGRCKVCPKSNAFLSLIVVYLGAGILLVAVITKFRLTVTNGSLNGLIFYANFVHWNRIQFFPNFSNSDLLRIVIAWLNLDLGIEVCFYNGMTALELIWLKIAYVFYIFFLQLTIITLCRKYIIFTRLFGRNITKAMSTLVILLFSKIIQIANEAFHYTRVENPVNKTHFCVLSIDGKSYISKEHIPLMVVGTMISALLLLFTFYLLFNQILIKISSIKCFKWVARLQPFFETITGPCNSNYTFWPGFLFLAKIGYFLCYYLEPRNKLLFPALISMICLVFSFLGPKGVYKKWSLNILELTVLLNLGITCALITLHKTVFTTYLSRISVGITILLHLSYHFYEQGLLNKVKELLLKCTELCKPSRIREPSPPQVVTHSEVVVSPTEHAPLLPAQDMNNYGILREPLLDTTPKQ